MNHYHVILVQSESAMGGNSICFKSFLAGPPAFAFELGSVSLTVPTPHWEQVSGCGIMQYSMIISLSLSIYLSLSLYIYIYAYT